MATDDLTDAVKAATDALFAHHIKEGIRLFSVTGAECEDLARVALSAAAPMLIERARRQALSEAYWRIREHASGYRGADAFRDAMGRRHDSESARRIGAVHEFFARGIESAATDDVADLLGLAEDEEPPA